VVFFRSFKPIARIIYHGAWSLIGLVSAVISVVKKARPLA
jgi:hypothetical protein